MIELEAELQSVMNGILAFLLLYLHLFLGLIAGVLILWRIKTRRRWWGALLAYVCLILMVSLPFMGTYTSTSTFTSSEELCTDCSFPN